MNTLNRKQYASEGHRFQLDLYGFAGRERFVPLQEEPSLWTTRNWLQARLRYESYFRTTGFSKLGFMVEGVWSNQPYFKDRQATRLMRSDERRVGNTGVRTRRFWWSQYH